MFWMQKIDVKFPSLGSCFFWFIPLKTLGKCLKFHNPLVVSIVASFSIGNNQNSQFYFREKLFMVIRYFRISSVA